MTSGIFILMQYKEKKRFIKRTRKKERIKKFIDNGKGTVEDFLRSERKYKQPPTSPKKIKQRIARHERSASKLSKQQIENDSPNERKFRHLLIEYGIKHVYQKPFFCVERFVCVDFYFPEQNIVIEIDGAEHHNEIAVAKDALRTEYIKNSHGVKHVLRITNKQLANEIENVKELVISKLTS